MKSVKNNTIGLLKTDSVIFAVGKFVELYSKGVSGLLLSCTLITFFSCKLIFSCNMFYTTSVTIFLNVTLFSTSFSEICSNNCVKSGGNVL